MYRLQENEEFAEAKDEYREDAELEYGSSGDDEPDPADVDAREDPSAVLANVQREPGEGDDGALKPDTTGKRRKSKAPGDAIEALRGEAEAEAAGEGGDEDGPAAKVQDGGPEPKSKRARGSRKSAAKVVTGASKFETTIRHMCVLGRSRVPSSRAAG